MLTGRKMRLRFHPAEPCDGVLTGRKARRQRFVSEDIHPAEHVYEIRTRTGRRLTDPTLTHRLTPYEGEQGRSFRGTCLLSLVL